MKRKTGGVLEIDGIRMHSPATIDSDRPGEFKILYDPGVDDFDTMGENKREPNRISRAG